MGKRELVALLNLPSLCLVMVERLFLTMPWGCLRFVSVVFPDHTQLLFLKHDGMSVILCPTIVDYNYIKRGIGVSVSIELETSSLLAKHACYRLILISDCH